MTGFSSAQLFTGQEKVLVVVMKLPVGSAIRNWANKHIRKQQL